jgi:tetratricopeptide (TPR) repeat protein
MPKRNVKVISHSVLTNHRIVVAADEPFPDAAFHMTTAGLPDLVHLNAKPGTIDVPSPLTLLEAYRQVMVSHPDYRERYWALARQLQTSHPENIFVLEALADLSLQKKNVEGMSAATSYLDRARNLGSTKPSDFELLARLLVAARQQAKAADVLRQGIDLIPYDAELYRLLARINLSLGRARDACGVLANANHIFPQDSDIRSLLKECATADSSPSQQPVAPSAR